MGKYRFDREFFDVPCMTNTYWAGFIAADGNVALNRNTISIDLASKDRSHLTKFRQNVDGNFRIEDRDRREKGIQSRVRVDSKEWKLALDKNYNIVPRKTLLLLPPYLDSFLSLCYLAGYIDGDGSVSNGYIKIVGTEKLLTWAKNFLDSLFPSDLTNRQCHVRPVKDTNCYEFVFGGHRAQRLMSIMNSLPLPLMERKWGYSYAG